MAAKNWRENAETTGNQPKNVKAPKTRKPITEPSEPLRLGPVVKGVAFVLTLVALFFAGMQVWEILKPPQKTTVHLLNDKDKDFAADVYASGLYAQESAELFGAGNAHLDLSGSSNAKPHLGPNKNTLLFYRNGDLTIDFNERDEDVKTVQISRNGSGESRYQSESWMDLRKLFERICEEPINGGAKINRVLILDVGEVDENVLWQGVSIDDEIKSLLRKMQNDGVANLDRFWILISASDHQTSWYAPELGSSVFAYFVSRGLEGEANKNSEEISLGDLNDYVEQSVNSWVRDYRDSSQIPRLLTVAKTDAQDVALVFQKGGNDRLSDDRGELDYHKNVLAGLWETFRAKQIAFPQMPHHLSRMESRLIRLEEVRYGEEKGVGRSGRVFRKLKSELEELDRFLQPEKVVSEAIVSIEQQQVPVNSDRLQELSSYLFPPPPPPALAQNEDKGDSSPKAKVAAKIPELPETLKTLDRENWLRLVWAYFNSDLAALAPITQAKFKECLDLIESSAGETGTQVKDAPVQWSELQYLTLLRDNVDWKSEEEPGFSNQKSAVLNAIACRKKSEGLIRSSAISNEYRSGFARAWPLVRDEFIALELERRRAEDLLFANDLAVASSNLAKLSNQYGVLIEKTQSLIQMQRQSQEALHIIPHLRRFLINEATHFQTTDSLQDAIRGLSSTQRTAYSLADQLRTEASDYEAALDSFESLSGDMKSIRAQFKSDYFDRLADGNKSAADVVFHAMNILDSPIPEWYGGGYREKIRQNLDGWIADQYETFTNEVWEAKQDSGSKVTLSNVDLRSVLSEIPKPKTEGVLGELKLDSLGSVGASFGKLKPGGDYFDEHFNPQQEKIEGLASLLEWQSRLESLDFEIRERNEIFSTLDSALDGGLDVGRQLALLDSILLAHDRFERAKFDCWGAGDVENLTANQELPPFVLFGLVEYEEMAKALGRLQSVESRDDKDRMAFQVEGLAAEFEEDRTALAESWRKLKGSRLAWATATQPSEFKDSLTFETKLESELLPRDVGDTDPLTMSATLDLKRKTIRQAKPFEYSGSASVLPKENLMSGELQTISDFDQVVGFRGHQIKGQFSMTKEKTIAPEIASYKTTQTRSMLGPPSVGVVNENETQGDIVFILDCSNSMNEAVGDVNEAGVNKPRFEIAKAALARAISELGKTKRFRFSLYAFGHRSQFVAKNRKLVLDSNGMNKIKGEPGVHPFDDCECLFSLSRNSGRISSTKDVDQILGELNNFRARGITPLFYSIKKAAEDEFSEQGNRRQKYMVVLTDGENKQLEGNRFKNRSLPRKNASETTPGQAAIALGAANLFVARISQSGGTSDGESRLLTMAGAKKILNVKDNNSDAIADAILNAIGRSQFSVARKGDSEVKRIEIPKTIDDMRPGKYVVETFGVAKPDSFDVELHNGVSVLFKNTSRGLVLDRGNTPNFARSPLPVDCNLAAGKYRVGPVASRDNELAVGFEKLTNLAGSNFRNFSFRPQRIWAQVSDGETKERLFNLFLPEYRPGQYPIAVFKFPKTGDRLSKFDVRLWIAPSVNDGGRRIAPYVNEIGIGKTTNLGITCELERDNAKGTSTIAVDRPAGEERDFFVGGPDVGDYVHLTTVVDGVRTEKYEYKINEVNANFTLSALPQEEFISIMQRVGNSPKNFGKDLDPIFRDRGSVWIDFEGVKINN